MIRQKHTITITDTASLTLAQRGAVILNKGTAFTVTVVASAILFGNLWYEFINIGAGTVTVVEDGGGTLATLQQDESATLINTGTAWQVGGVKVHTLGVSTATSIDFGGTTLLESRALTIDTGGVFNIVLDSEPGDDFTVGTDKFVVEGDTGNVGIGEPNPSQALDLIGSLELEETVSSITGVIYKATNRFLHDYTPPGAVNHNLFLGIGAGNFSMAIDGQSYHASNNTGIGYAALNALTTGFNNTATGFKSLSANTSGYNNTAVGYDSLRYNQEGIKNVAIGYQAGAGVSASNYSNNIFIGYQAGNSITTGSGNIIIGYDQDMPTGATDDHLNIGGLIYGDLSTKYVGMGTPTPLGSLHIEADSADFIITQADGKYSLKMATNNDGIAYFLLFANTVGGEIADSLINFNTLAGSDNWINISGNFGLGTPLPDEKLQVSGNIFLTTDSQKMLFGTGKDMSIYYDGTDGYIKTDEVAPSDLHITTGADKTLVLDTAVYKDINMAGYLLTLPASSKPDVVNFVDKNGADTAIPTYAFAVDEYVSGGFELQHDYKNGTDLVFHVHWQGIAAPIGTDNVQWRLTYIVMRGETVLEPAVTIDSPDTAFDVQYETKRTDFGTIDGSGYLIEDQFMFNLWRVAATGDAYTGDALIQTAGIHYQIERLGSRTILAA